MRNRLLVALALFGLSFAANAAIAHYWNAATGSAAELQRPLSDFPTHIDLWVGTDTQADAEMVRSIKIDGYLQRRFTHPSGEQLTLWMSYSRRSTDQYHYPTVCMQGAGWKEHEWARATVPVNDGALVRMAFSKSERRQLVYYWYYLMGEDERDRLMRRLSKTARAFLRGRRNGSLTVEVFSLSPHPNQELLDSFAHAVAAELGDWMPSNTELASDLGADY